MAAKIDQLGIEFGIGPVGLENRRLQVVEIDGEGRPAELSEGRLDATQKGLGVLAQDGLAISFARIAQDQAKDPGLPLFAVGFEQCGPGAKVHLHLFARFDLNPLNQLRIGAAQSTDVALDRLIGTGEGDLHPEILVNPLGRQTLFELGQD